MRSGYDVLILGARPAGEHCAGRIAPGGDDPGAIRGA